MNTPLLRAVTAADRGFLRDLYAASREEELAVTGWDRAAKDAFCDLQFSAQDAHWREAYPDASFDVVEVGGQRVGRLYVDRRADEIRIVDILIGDPHRGQGIGAALMARLIAESERDGLALTLHVELFNPVHQWYRRLGFVPVDQTGVYHLYRRDPRSRQ